jgi:hypothetical protein
MRPSREPSDETVEHPASAAQATNRRVDTERGKRVGAAMWFWWWTPPVAAHPDMIRPF